MVNLRRRVLTGKAEEEEYVESTVIFTPLSGSGTEKTSNVIDSTLGECYFTLPFIEGDTRLASGATSTSTPTRVLAYLYSDPECTAYVGAYNYKTGNIGSAGTQASRPVIPFDTKIMLIPKGYYAKVHFSRSSVTAFNDNSKMSGYISLYGELVRKELV